MSNVCLYNEDCFDTIKTIPDKSVDIAFFSPPYNRKRIVKAEQNKNKT